MRHSLAVAISWIFIFCYRGQLLIINVNVLADCFAIHLTELWNLGFCYFRGNRLQEAVGCICLSIFVSFNRFIFCWTTWWICWNLMLEIRNMTDTFLGPNFQNFLGRSLEDFFPKKVCGFSKLIWKMSLEEFEKIFQRRFWERVHNFWNFFGNFLQRI